MNGWSGLRMTSRAGGAAEMHVDAGMRTNASFSTQHSALPFTMKLSVTCVHRAAPRPQLGGGRPAFMQQNGRLCVSDPVPICVSGNHLRGNACNRLHLAPAVPWVWHVGGG